MHCFKQHEHPKSDLLANPALLCMLGCELWQNKYELTEGVFKFHKSKYCGNLDRNLSILYTSGRPQELRGFYEVEDC